MTDITNEQICKHEWLTVGCRGSECAKCGKLIIPVPREDEPVEDEDDDEGPWPT